MTSDQSMWFVKASFGAEWGPMSAETLLQMAAEGAFAGDDVARVGADGLWQPVFGVLEALRSGVDPVQTDQLAEAETEPLAEIDSEMIPEHSVVADHSEAKPVRRSSLPGWTTYWAPDSNTEESAPLRPQFALTAETSANDLRTFAIEIEAATTEESTSRTDQSIEAEITTSDPHDVESDGRFDELNAWKRERTERLDRLLKIVAEREAAAAREAATAKPEVAETGSHPNNDNQAPHRDESTEGDRSPLATAEPQARPRVVARRPEKWEETLARWRRSVPDWRFALPLLLLPWLVWNFWPVSNGSIAKDYRFMYSELRRLRDLPLNKSSMDEFVSRSQVELDELLPKLKPRATSKDPDSQLLYWIGHDCLKPMLKSPRLRNTKQEDMLKKLLAQWDRAHHIEPEAEKSDAITEQPLPVSSSATPLGFGKSNEPAEPVDVELPPPSQKTKPKPQPVENEDPN